MSFRPDLPAGVGVGHSGAGDLGTDLENHVRGVAGSYLRESHQVLESWSYEPFEGL